MAYHWGPPPKDGKFYIGPKHDTPWNRDLNWKDLVRREDDFNNAATDGKVVLRRTHPRNKINQGSSGALIFPDSPIYRVKPTGRVYPHQLADLESLSSYGSHRSRPVSAISGMSSAISRRDSSASSRRSSRSTSSLHGRSARLGGRSATPLRPPKDIKQSILASKKAAARLQSTILAQPVTRIAGRGRSKAKGAGSLPRVAPHPEEDYDVASSLEETVASLKSSLRKDREAQREITKKLDRLISDVRSFVTARDSSR